MGGGGAGCVPAGVVKGGMGWGGKDVVTRGLGGRALRTLVRLFIRGARSRRCCGGSVAWGRARDENERQNLTDRHSEAGRQASKQASKQADRLTRKSRGAYGQQEITRAVQRKVDVKLFCVRLCAISVDAPPRRSSMPRPDISSKSDPSRDPTTISAAASRVSLRSGAAA